MKSKQSEAHQKGGNDKRSILHFSIVYANISGGKTIEGIASVCNRVSGVFGVRITSSYSPDGCWNNREMRSFAKKFMK